MISVSQARRLARASTPISVAAALSITVTPAQSNPNGANSAGWPGEWLPAIAHGDHSAIGCNNDDKRFYPIHAALIPKGPFQGCVLVWEKGDQGLCRTYVNFPTSYDAHADQRWAIFDPRTSPPTIHKFAWRIRVSDAAQPPCQSTNPQGHQALFCSGHCWLPDGQLLVAGGDYWLAGTYPQGTVCSANTVYAGSRMLAIFNPDDVDLTAPRLQTANGPGLGSPWTSRSAAGPAGAALALREARWYPSVTMMAPAALTQQSPFVYISVAGGIEKLESNALPSTGDPSYSTHELYRFDVFQDILSRDPRQGTTPNPQTGLFIGPTTPSGTGLSFLYYPRVHFMSGRTGSPDGRLWMAGMSIQSADADVINYPEVWNNSGAVLSIGSGKTLIEEPTVVLFPPINPTYRDVQMVMGGMRTDASHVGTSQDIVWDVSFTATRTNPAWIQASHLHMERERKFANAVILPDASVVVVGGGTNPAHGGTGNAQFEAEMFHNGSWYLLSDQLSERTYHSVALLLPDGTVLSAGGDTCADGAEYEILVPPYLQSSPSRPAFSGTQPTTINYATQHTFTVSVPFGQSLDRVVLLSPGSVTHSQDPNQRYEPLSFDIEDTGSLLVTGPGNPTQCPPGYYMMFLVSSAGVPSVAHWIRVMP